MIFFGFGLTNLARQNVAWVGLAVLVKLVSKQLQQVLSGRAKLKGLVRRKSWIDIPSTIEENGESRHALSTKSCVQVSRKVTVRSQH